MYFEQVDLTFLGQCGRGQDLNRYRPVGFSVFGTVDNAHPASTKFGEDLIVR